MTESEKFLVHLLVKTENILKNLLALKLVNLRRLRL